MKIALYDMTGPDVVVDIHDDGWFPHEEVTRVTEPAGRVEIQRIGDKEAELRGSLEVQVVFACDRCLDEARINLSTQFDYRCKVGTEEIENRPEYECRQDDYTQLYLKEPVIDLGEVLREQLYLALPQTTLCSPDCHGLCPQCGENLNRVHCSCERLDESSPFAVLRHLKGS